jgi:hypothetical protein
MFYDVAISVPGHDVDLTLTPACEVTETYRVWADDEYQAQDYAGRQQRIIMGYPNPGTVIAWRVSADQS